MATDIIKYEPVTVDFVLNPQNLSSTTTKAYIDDIVNYAPNLGLRVVSAAGGSKFQDFPVVQAGTYLILPHCYYKQVIFFGTDGSSYLYNYSSNEWVHI